MHKKISGTIFLFFILEFVYAQPVTQNVRGSIVDKNSQIPLPGVNVILLNSTPLKGTVTDLNGDFNLTEIPVGRQSIKVSFIGYNPITLNNLEVRSGKELILKLELEEKILEEVVVNAYRKNNPINDMASISARSFTIEETERYAGSWGDPSRMAVNFAGVMAGGDQVNDIIIRGNSPNGLLWRMEGINIPNPNHFGSLGTTGGPISMLNNNVLNNSDFFTAAFPAEYGNALSGTFDLRLRNGNNQKHEFLAQVGFNGFEAGLEGPLNKTKRSSYLANYRYSTMALIDRMGVDMGIGATPYYQDVCFKFNFPDAKLGKISVWGLGGLSHISFANTDENLRTDDGTYFTSDMGVAGISNTKFFNKKTRLKTNFAVSGTRTTTHDSIIENDVIEQWYGDKSHEIKYSFSTQLIKKFNSKNNLQIGAIADYLQFSYLDSFYLTDYQVYRQIKDIDDNLMLYQGFVQWKHRFDDNHTLFAGVHSQTSSLNEEITIEPRVSLKKSFARNQSISLGYGLHSQLQPRSVYFSQLLVDTLNETYSSPNKELDFSKAHHLVLGYDYLIAQNLRLKTEAYYQYLFDIPIDKELPHVSMLNHGRTYFRDEYDTLINEGTGYNYGVELTLEKFLSNNYYFLFTTSLFESKYEGSDGKIRNTAFNGNYVINGLVGYEIPIKEIYSLAFDLKGTIAGGLRKMPIDLEASRAAEKTVYDYANIYEEHHDYYGKMDMRISLKMNKSKFSQEWAFEITNFTGRKNFFAEIYNSKTGEIENASQMGAMPMMFWRINF